MLWRTVKQCYYPKHMPEQMTPVIEKRTEQPHPVGTGYIDAVMMMPTAWNIEKQALEVTSKYGLDERVSINDACKWQRSIFQPCCPL